jgi:uncharacterized OB-fold protein
MTAETLVYAPAALGQPTQLAASRCPRCDRVQFPSTASCPVCSVPSIELWLAGPAKLVFATQILAEPPDSLVSAPYGVGVAEFDEGIRVIGLLDDPPSAVGDLVVPVVYQAAVELVTFAFGRPGEKN